MRQSGRSLPRRLLWHPGLARQHDLGRFPGELRYRPADGDQAGQEQIAAVSSGLVKVENNDVLVLVDTAEHPEEIDTNRARRAADAAKEALLQKRSIQEYKVAQYNLARAMSRLRVHSDFENHR